MWLSEFATARSGLPSPLRSPIATEAGHDPTSKLVAEAEGAGAIAEEDRDVGAALIHHGQVGLAIAIEVPDGDGVRVYPRGEVGGGVEGAGTGAEEDRDVDNSPRPSRACHRH